MTTCIHREKKSIRTKIIIGKYGGDNVMVKSITSLPLLEVSAIDEKTVNHVNAPILTINAWGGYHVDQQKQRNRLTDPK
jgi:hypothetical protein